MTDCSGWQQIQIKHETAVWLDQNDQQALRGLIGHQEFGKAQGCWP
jgi:hypothetical protein